MGSWIVDLGIVWFSTEHSLDSSGGGRRTRGTKHPKKVVYRSKEMTCSRHLLIVDANLEAEVLDQLRGVLESTERTVQVVHETEAVFLLSLLSAGIFASVGVVFHGPGIPSWLLDDPMVEAVNRSLTAQGSLDLLGCGVRPEDLTLSALYALYPNHPVCASTDITGAGPTGNWTLELLVQDGGRVSLDQTRSLARLYFTSAVYNLDVQLFGSGWPIGGVTPTQAEFVRRILQALEYAGIGANVTAEKLAAANRSALKNRP